MTQVEKVAHDFEKEVFFFRYPGKSRKNDYRIFSSAYEEFPWWGMKPMLEIVEKVEQRTTYNRAGEPIKTAEYNVCCVRVRFGKNESEYGETETRCVKIKKREK